MLISASVMVRAKHARLYIIPRKILRLETRASCALNEMKIKPQ